MLAIVGGPGTDPATSVVHPIRPLVAVGKDEPLDGARSRPGLARMARLLVVCVDGVTVVGAMAVAYAMLPSLYLDADSVASSAYQRVGLLSMPLWLIVFRHYRLYNARHVTERRDEVGRVVHAVGMSALLTALVAYFLDQPVERSWYLMLFGVGVAVMLVERELVRFGFAALRRRGHCLRPVAVAGTGAEALAMVRTFTEKPQLGYSVVGLIGDRDQVVPELADRYPLFDPRSKVVEELRMAGAAGVVVATTDVDAETSNRLIRN
ncbi:MAG: hypothetical protein H0U41_10935, partial [Actinobacteria bacterium]|nr:hypothetical protein [Actinomycetota bacterium]